MGAGVLMADAVKAGFREGDGIKRAVVDHLPQRQGGQRGPVVRQMHEGSREAIGALDFSCASAEIPSMSAEKLKTEALIVGGGLVGLTLGLALARGGVRSIVVDALDPAAVTDAGFDGRVSAIAFASCRMFRALNMWDDLAPHAQPINDIMVTDSRGPRAADKGAAAPLFLHYDHREIGDEPLGNLIENRHTRIAQQRAIEREDLVTLIAPDAVMKVDYGPHAVIATLKSGQQIEAQVAFACDGRGSPTREAAGIKTVNWSYDQIGIVCTVEHDRPHEGIAQEYFLPSGPFAILPMVGNRSSLVWTEKTALGKAMLALDDDQFAEQIADRFGPFLGKTQPMGPRWSYPLGFQIARDYVRPRLALVGDAAHGVHPIAGQGLNLGLRDVAALAEVIVDTARLGLDIGSLDCLRRYEKWRRFDNTALSLGMDALVHLFSNDVTPIRIARDIGLGVVNELPPLRKLFMRHAGGTVALGGEENLPRLLRGEAV